MEILQMGSRHSSNLHTLIIFLKLEVGNLNVLHNKEADNNGPIYTETVISAISPAPHSADTLMQ